MRHAFQFVGLILCFASCGSSNESHLDDRERELIRREAKLEAQEELNAQKQEPADAKAAPEAEDKSREQRRPDSPTPTNFFVGGVGRYPFTSERLIDYRDVRGLSTWDLTIMRNEIFARHGYIFKKNEDVIRYFNNQSWYRPVSDEVDLSEIEKANIHFIKSLEENAG